MTIKHEAPPFYSFIHRKFPNADLETTIFTFYPNVYFPGDLHDHLVAHEEVHLKQQRSYIGAIIWWLRCAYSTKYQYSQEIPAYQRQYEFALSKYGKNKARMLLSEIAVDLSGPRYNNQVTFQKARNDILGV